MRKTLLLPMVAFLVSIVSLSPILVSAPIPGDVDGIDGVNIADVTIASLAFGSAAVDDLTTPWNETVGWDSRADLNLDNKVNIFDLVIIGINFGAGT